MIFYTDHLIMNNPTNVAIKRINYMIETPSVIESELRNFVQTQVFIRREMRQPQSFDARNSSTPIPDTIKISIDAFCDIITDYSWEFMEQTVEYVDRDFPNQEPFYDEFHPLYKLVHACTCTEKPLEYIYYVFEHFPVSSDVVVFLFLYYEESWENYIDFVGRCSDKPLLAKKILAQCKNESQIDAIFPIIEQDETIISSTTNLATLRFLCDRVALPRQKGLMTHIRSPVSLKAILEGKAYDGSFDDLEEGFIKNTLFLEAIVQNCHRTIQYLFESMDCTQLEEPHVKAFLRAERSTQALIETIYSLTRVFKKATLGSIVDAIIHLEKHSVYLLRILTRFVEEKVIDSGELVIQAISHILSLAQNDEDICETLYVALPIIDHNVIAHFAIHHPKIMKIAHDQFDLRFHASVVMNNPIVCLFDLPLEYAICDESFDYVKNFIDGIKKKLCLEDHNRIPSLVYAPNGDKVTMRPTTGGVESECERYNITVFILNPNGSNPFFEEHYFHKAKVLKCYTKNHSSTYSVTVELGEFNKEKSRTQCNGSFILSQQGIKKPIPAIVLPRERWLYARNIEKEITKEEQGIPTLPCFDLYSASFDFRKKYYVKIMMVDNHNPQNETL